MKRDFTYIDDIAQGTVTSLRSVGFEVVNLGGDAPHSVNQLIELGISAIIQPGGSINDDKVIKAANEAGIVMAFTGPHHFKH